MIGECLMCQVKSKNIIIKNIATYDIMSTVI